MGLVLELKMWRHFDTNQKLKSLCLIILFILTPNFLYLKLKTVLFFSEVRGCFFDPKNLKIWRHMWMLLNWKSSFQTWLIFFDIKNPERKSIYRINKLSNLISTVVIFVIFFFIYLKRTTNMFYYISKNSGFNTCLAWTDIESILLSNLLSGHYSLHHWLVNVSNLRGISNLHIAILNTTSYQYYIPTSYYVP